MGYLISLFSSDLNNFLSVAAGNMRAVQRHLSDKPHHSHRVQAAFRAMDGATQNSQKLAHAIRPSAPSLRSLSVQSVLEAVIDWAELNLGEHFQFELIVAAGLPHLMGDEEQIAEIARILLRNATEAMPEGGLVIVECDCVHSEAHVKKARRARPYLRISVNDGGVGIPEPILERIFDPCYSTKPRQEGLGLTRAHALAGGHHGYLTVSSDPGMGSTFEVFLPLDAPAHRLPGLEPMVAAPAGVLVYEENENSRIALERVLSACGYRADCYAEADVAFGAWRARALAGNPYRTAVIGWSGKGTKDLGGQLWSDILGIDARARGIAVLPFGERMSELDLATSGLHGALRSPLSLDQVGRVVGEAFRQQRRRPA
ncbi:MAG: hypothetical protein KDH09_13635 [Chrysiogenetes bacterium]|nr:hypothetical protein [Chrysiogenetes bacterium]